MQTSYSNNISIVERNVQLLEKYQNVVSISSLVEIVNYHLNVVFLCCEFAPVTDD